MPWWCPAEAYTNSIEIYPYCVNLKKKKKVAIAYVWVGITSVPAQKVFSSDGM